MLRRPWLQRLCIDSVVIYRARPWRDMLCAIPALRALRAALPTAHITLVGQPGIAQIAHRFCSYLDEFIPFPGQVGGDLAAQAEQLANFYAQLTSRRFSLALQLHGSSDGSNRIVAGFGARAMAGHSNSTQLSSATTLLAPYPDCGAEPARLLHLLERLGAPTRDCQLEFPLLRDDTDELAACALTGQLAPGSYLCLHPGAVSEQDGWPAARFAAVADQLADEFGLQIVLTGEAHERAQVAAVMRHMRNDALDVAGTLSIGAMAALMHGARLLICNDTTASHIAAGLGVHSVVVFRKADIARWAPCDRLRHRCIWDPAAERTNVVLEHARALLAGVPAARQKAAGILPYW